MTLCTVPSQVMSSSMLCLSMYYSVGKVFPSAKMTFSSRSAR